MNKQQRDYEKAKQAKRRVEMKMEAREKSFLKGRGLMDSEGTEADSLIKSKMKPFSIWHAKNSIYCRAFLN